MKLFPPSPRPREVGGEAPRPSMRVVSTLPESATAGSRARSGTRVVSTSDPDSSSSSAEPRRTLLVHNIELAGLLVVTLVVCFGALLTYFGQMMPLSDDEARLARGEIVNVNAVRSAKELMPALEEAFPDTSEAFPSDRAFAARELFRRLSALAAEGRPLDHVGALGYVRVDPARVRETPGLATLRERAANRQEPFALLTSAQIAAIKPNLAVRDRGAFRNRLIVATLILLAGFYLAHAVRRWKGQQGDAVLLPALHLLCGIGFLAMIALRDPLRDTTAFLVFAQGVTAGCVLIAAVSQIDFQRASFRDFVGIPLALALMLSALLVLFGSGPGTSDAKVNLFGVQPVEAIRLLVVFSLAAYFARRWEMLRELSEKRGEGEFPSWVSPKVAPWLARALSSGSVPRLVDVRPLAISMTLVIGFFFWQRDLGPALVIGVLFLTMYAVARARVVLVLLALVSLIGAFYVGYQLRTPRTVAQRVDIWLSPWDNGQPGGDQVAQALWAMSAGGQWGAGPGLGDPQMIPAGHTDLVLATIGEEFGWLGIVAVLVALGLVIVRSLRIAARAPGDYTFFLVFGLTITLAAQALLIASGLLGLLPLSGVVTPFLSFGRSSMLANCFAIGVVLAVAERARGPVRASFARQVRWVRVALVLAGLAVLARASWVQVVRADETLTEASLTLQGDGARRYTYNPRLLAAARSIERGTILDRHGVPLASSRAAELTKHKDTFAHLGIKLDEACPPRETGRCYPFGGSLFHVIGDWNTQRNWAASNTSFIERDVDRDLRGYDDGAKVIQITNARTGATHATIRRDYRALVPLVRHRYQPDHPDVVAVRQGVRDVMTTIDVRLQLRTARALERHIRENRYSRGAVVVMDPATGNVLASVSYPWPSKEPASANVEDDAKAQPLLDRARYGLYPPGSTFKLVTAMAALRQDPSLAQTEFECRHLQDSRVGIQLPGWSRPIRDDELDKTPHGSVAMTHGIVVSCNAYFAQLGVRVGPQAIADTAAMFQIAAAEPATAGELRKALPFASYGQGEVLASPLRMAVVAGTIAAGGVIPQATWIEEQVAAAPVSKGQAPAKQTESKQAESKQVAAKPESAPKQAVRVLDKRLAASLAGAMRQVVTSGTGRTLSNAAMQVAGKTGTAQVDGAASHSWFVGFAPFGEDAESDTRKRIAFAVMLENAGYGARATPVVAEVVRAAKELGIAR